MSNPIVELSKEAQEKQTAVARSEFHDGTEKWFSSILESSHSVAAAEHWLEVYSDWLSWYEPQFQEESTQTAVCAQSRKAVADKESLVNLAAVPELQTIKN